uniref:Tspy n=1 Tax=Mesocricetus auratus TaxID=10036 RepID=Q15J14_MESAU|nr:Tspy [Mesocricetus auratus]
MACPKEGREGVFPQELLELALLECDLEGGESQVHTPEKRPGSPVGDSQPVKPLVVVSGTVQTCVPPEEALPQPHTWEEGNKAAMGKIKVAEMEVRNEGKKENEDEHKKEDKHDVGPVLGKDLQQACHSKDQSGITRRPESVRQPAKHRSKMEELELLQLELTFVNARCSRAFARIRAKVVKMRKAHLERRKNIIQAIPGFWSKAMINHPQILPIITNQDEDLLRYMLSLEVVEANNGLRMCRMIFFFSNNPYFWNEIITKDYEFTITGYKESDSSVIVWIGQTEHGYANCIQDPTRLSFFNWLCTRNYPGSNRIAEIIMDELWPNPLCYYPKEDQS